MDWDICSDVDFYFKTFGIYAWTATDGSASACLQVAVRNIRRDALKAYEKLEKVRTHTSSYLNLMVLLLSPIDLPSQEQAPFSIV